MTKSVLMCHKNSNFKGTLYRAERNKPSYSYRSLSVFLGVCSSNTYDGIRFESAFGHVKRKDACLEEVQRFIFESPLLYNKAKNLTCIYTYPPNNRNVCF